VTPGLGVVVVGLDDVVVVAAVVVVGWLPAVTVVDGAAVVVC